MSFTSVDLPEPLTPVTHVNVPSGIVTGMPFRLCWRGLSIVSESPLPLRRVAATLLDTYVGNRAGEKILGGQIRRGHTESMNAAIWLSDLRGFTALSDRLPPETVVDILNNYFDC